MGIVTPPAQKDEFTQNDIDRLTYSIRIAIRECDENIELFKEVIEHIKRNRAPGARGIVWDYSPYMNIEECEAIIKLNEKAIEDYKDLYGKLIILENAKNLNDSVVSLCDFCFSKGLTDLINDAIYKHNHLIDSFDIIKKENEKQDDNREQIESLIKKYSGGNKK